MTNTNPLTYIEQMNALALIEDVARGGVGIDVAAVHLVRDPRIVREALGVALGLLQSALDAEPGRSTAEHLTLARERMAARDIDPRAV